MSVRAGYHDWSTNKPSFEHFKLLAITFGVLLLAAASRSWLPLPILAMVAGLDRTCDGHSGGAPLPHIQARLGHESITTTIDTYGHLLPVGDELISRIIDAALTGGTIRPMSTP